MGIISWLIVGCLAGWIASIIMGKNAQMGFVANLVTGVIGAFIGGAVVSFFGKTGVSGINIWSILVSVLGAVILLWIISKIKK